MFFITGDTIKLTRGDTARLNINIQNETSGEEYAIQSDDVLTFSLKRQIKDNIPKVHKDFIGTNTITIMPEDTRELPFGNYYYDIQLTTASKEIYTVIGPATFELLTEVTAYNDTKPDGDNNH